MEGKREGGREEEREGGRRWKERRREGGDGRKEGAMCVIKPIFI